MRGAKTTDLSLWVGPEKDGFDGLHDDDLPSIFLLSVRTCVLNSGPSKELCMRQGHAFVEVCLDSDRRWDMI
jgi:hypothetical protein